MMAELGAISVSQLNEYIKHKFDGDLVLKGISVSGEISNCKTYSSGHMYFTLKDSNSALKCVMFKGYRQTLTFKAADGDNVIVNGDITVYTRDGVYQLYATGIRKSGQGELYLKFLELKNKLEEEGLFDEYRKKPLPKYPNKIGVITSDSGAVYHDIKNVVGRRFPIAEICLFASRVQGEGADEELIEALKQMDKSGCDVAIIARGGGSIEDLWQFNSERLAREIAKVQTPIISAVGHETDFTIADFVSDMRAPTPSAAAEIAVPDVRDIYLRLASLEDAMTSAIEERLIHLKRTIESYRNDIARSLHTALLLKRNQVEQINRDLKQKIASSISMKKLKLAVLAEKLNSNNPIHIMERGFFPISSKSKRIYEAKQLKKDDEIEIKFTDGEVFAKIVGGITHEQDDV